MSSAGQFPLIEETFFLIDINFKVERALYFEARDALLVVAG